jgi:hypothetical protein
MQTTTPTKYLEFVLLPSFERSAAGLFTEEDIRALEQTLLADPRAGDVVQGTGGVRKVRAAQEGRGKRGSARVIYLYVEVRERVFLLWAFGKNDQANLTPEQVKRVRQLVETLKSGEG